MKQSIRTETDKFRRELDRYQAKLASFSGAGRETSFLEKQLVFWIESARFLVNELEIWGNVGADTKYKATFQKVRNNLDYVHELIAQLAKEQARNTDNEEDG
jgi:hypothetical protein